MEHPKSYESSSEAPLAIEEALFPKLDFEETPDLAEARQVIVEALKNDLDPANRKEMWIEYIKIGEQITNALGVQDIEGRAKVHTALILHKALVFHKVGDQKRYIEELIDAEEYAVSVGLDSVAEPLYSEIEKLSNSE